MRKRNKVLFGIAGCLFLTACAKEVDGTEKINDILKQQPYVDVQLGEVIPMLLPIRRRMYLCEVHTIIRYHGQYTTETSAFILAHEHDLQPVVILLHNEVVGKCDDLLVVSILFHHITSVYV